ncbi:flavin reductase [Microvirga makkahensis]|uniref:Flavin reductase n=2 Tax=Microvirga makkahensis TaxID=1128670 RepID=A0A7X3SQU8_9HYPH|nr:flavin reductase [Microvirga makkahensis]
MPASSIASERLTGPTEFRLAMRELAATVSIVTAGQGDQRRGLTVTSLCSLSLEPPSLVVCVNKETDGHRAILQSGSFCVNVMAAEQRILSDCFAGRTRRRGLDRFADSDWTVLATGSPVLIDAIAVLDCDVINQLDHGTHTLFVGGVRAVRSDSNRPALIYRAGDYHVV